jgi:hypothetical protein
LHRPSHPAAAKSGPPPRRVSGTCIPCSPRSRNCARSAGSPDVSSNRRRITSRSFRMDTLLAGTLLPSLGGFIVPVLCPAPPCLWKSFRVHREKRFRGSAKTVRLPVGIAVHVQPGILFTISPERFSRSSRNRVHHPPESASRVAQYVKSPKSWIRAKTP